MGGLTESQTYEKSPVHGVRGFLFYSDILFSFPGSPTRVAGGRVLFGKLHGV